MLGNNRNDSFNGWKVGWQLGQWVVKSYRQYAERKRTEREISHTRKTGLPSPDTALGRKARQVADAEEAMLRAPPPIHGTARWGTIADARDMIGVRPGRELFLGFMMQPDGSGGPPLVARYPGHLLTVAGTGQGKSATQIVFNLLTYTGSVVVIDPKGELYDLTAERRRHFGKVVRLAPLARPGEPPSDRYNPLDELGDAREIGHRARRLAEMLIVRQGDKGAAEASFFESEAINLLTLIIIGVCETADRYDSPQDRTLAEVRRICSLPLLGGDREKNDDKKDGAKASTLDDGPTYLQNVLKMFAADGENLLLRQQAGSFAAYDRKLLASFVSEINSNLAFFDGHAGFAEATTSSDFRFSQLATEPTTVYLTIPLKDIGTSYRYLRAMVGQAFTALDEQRDAREASVLFILDEFPALRDMSFMRDAVAQMRSSGAWFWFFVQDLAQLRAVYGNWSDVFLSQTDYQVFFGAVNDANTKKYISTNLGVNTVAFRNENISWSHNVGVNGNDSFGPTQPGSQSDGRNVGQSVNINAPVQIAPRALLTPTEVGMFLGHRHPGETHPSASIIFAKGANGQALRARRVHWRMMFPPAPAPGAAANNAKAPAQVR